MGSKKLSILTELTLNAAGFDKGADAAKQKFNALKQGSEQAASSIKGAFANVAGMFTPMTEQLGGLSTGVMDGIKSFKSMVPAITSVKAAFIATGIGAIVIGLATAFASLVSWIKRTDEGGDSMRKVFDVIKAVINTVLDKLAALGSAIVKLFKGDFKGAGEDAKRAFTGWGDAIKDNIQKAKELNDIQDSLEDFNETKALRVAEIEEKISELRLKARDEETYNATQRLNFTKQLESAIKQKNAIILSGFELERQALQTEIKTNANNQELRQKYNEKLAEGLNLKAQGNAELKETVKLYNSLISQSKELEAVNADKAFQATASNAPIAAIQPKKLQGKGIDNGLVSNLTGSQLENYKKAVFDFQGYNEMLSNSFMTLGENIVFSFSKLGEALSQGAGSFKEYASNLKSAVKDIIGSLLANSVASMIAGQIKFWAKLGPAGLIAAPIAAGAAAGLVKTAFNSMIPKFETGGIVSGLSFSGDRIPALVNSGEMILNRSQQGNLFNMINRGQSFTGGEVRFRIEGNTLVGVLNNYNRQQNRFR